MITQLDQNTALVLIDLQQGILERASQAHAHLKESQSMEDMSDIPQLLRHSVDLIKAFHDHNLPVVIVNVDSYGEAWTKTRKDNPISGSQPPPENFTKIVDEIQPRQYDILVTKKSWSAFFNTGLHEKLQARGITQIVLGGVATSIGVEGTARDASVLAYNLSFAADAMSDFSVDAHRHSLTRIFPRIGEVGHTQDILNKLSSD